MLSKNAKMLGAMGALIMLAPLSAAFLVPRPVRTCSALNYRNLPSVQDVSTDEFTEQVYHASLIVRELSEGSSINQEEKDELSALLTAQLSHYDGMRGFFAAYMMTGQGETAADNEQVPALLLQAMKGSNFEHLAPLACMNLIVPTAMISVHRDPTLAANTAIVAQRTKRILSALKGSINIVRNCHAIVAVANGKESQEADKKLDMFWASVFDYYAYTLEQRQAIANAFAGVA